MPDRGSAPSPATAPVHPGDRAVGTFVAALLPHERGGPDPDVLAARIRHCIARFPDSTRWATLAGFVGIAAAMRVAAKGRDPRRLAPEVRSNLLARIAGSGPNAAAGIEGLKAIALLAHGSTEFAGVIAERARRNPPVVPDAAMDVTPADRWPSRTRADVVVVGSGAGGAMVARAAARAGLSVVVAEEGRRWSVEELRNGDPLDRYVGLYRDGGSTVAFGRPSVVLPMGRAVGGTTVVNSGTCFRPPLDVLRRWRDDHRLDMADPDALAPYLDEVEATLRTAPVPMAIMGNNGRALLRGAEALGWAAGPLVRNAPGCDGCCQCALGCPHNAKAGVHLNALPQACAAGARIVADARVDRVLTEAGRAIGVQGRRPDGTVFEVLAPRVVIAAGATETPGLLWRSGLGGHPEVGRNLAIHPATSVAGRFEGPVVAWEGVLQSAFSDELHETERIMIEATATPPGLGSMALPGYGADLLARIADAEHHALLGAMIGDRSSGRVRSVRGRTIVTYALAPDDAERLRVAVGAMGNLMLAAGAGEVILGLPDPERTSARNREELDDIVAGMDPRDLHLAALHPTGTVRAGGDQQAAPVDGEGRLRGVDGVRVADASIIPSCPEVNPQVTIMALASAVADAMISEG